MSVEKLVLSQEEKIKKTIFTLLKSGSDTSVCEIFNNSGFSLELSEYDNWDGGTYGFTIVLKTPIQIYARFQNQISSIEEKIKTVSQHAFKGFDRCWIQNIQIIPDSDPDLRSKSFQISNSNLISLLEAQKGLMVSVSTGGPQIKLVNSEYTQRQKEINSALNERSLKLPYQFDDLWKWHGKWSDGSLPTYRSRREFLGELFDPTIENLSKNIEQESLLVFNEPTGWSRVDRNIREIKARMSLAQNEEQFQAVGLLCRETLVSLGQAIFIKEIHHSLDGTEISDTDSKRMLDAYISVHFPGSSNEVLRKMAKACIDLTNTLTHRRTADFRLAAYCSESTTYLVNMT
jgi:hypothetical protein